MNVTLMVSVSSNTFFEASVHFMLFMRIICFIYLYRLINIYSIKKRTKEFLTNAIFDNDFMKNLESDQIENIVECMYPVEFAKNSIIIKEGDVGNIVYITQGNKISKQKSDNFSKNGYTSYYYNI